MQTITGSGQELLKTSERANTDPSPTSPTVQAHNPSDDPRRYDLDDFDEIFAYG